MNAKPEPRIPINGGESVPVCVECGAECPDFHLHGRHSSDPCCGRHSDCPEFDTPATPDCPHPSGSPECYSFHAAGGRIPRTPDSRLTCPTCKRPNTLTEREARRGYQCLSCTRAEEFGS